MARTAKTNHVLSLVGEKSKKAPSGNSANSRKEEIPSVIVNPALFPFENEKKEKDPQLPQQTAQTAEPKEELSEPDCQRQSEEALPQLQSGDGITAIVPELINQELKTIVERFNIEPDDNNLWRLTKAALETIRPEFSHNRQEYEKKCEELRQKVILEMTREAIKLSKDSRKK